MTLEQREQAYIAGLRALEAQYGMKIVPVTLSEQFGGATLVKSGLQIVPVDRWQSPPAPEQDGDNGGVE